VAYLLDSDVFIRAKNDHYGFDFCPGFWEWLDHATASGAVYEPFPDVARRISASGAGVGRHPPGGGLPLVSSRGT